MLPSFKTVGLEPLYKKPRIQVLEVRDRERISGAPIAWLAIERVEEAQRDSGEGPPISQSIRLYYELISSNKSYWPGCVKFFAGSYCKLTNSVSITSPDSSPGAVFLSLDGLENQRIGSYLMSEIVRWVKQWPDANVQRVELTSLQAREEDKKLLRNRFYENFGLRFEFTDADCTAGYSVPMKAKQLILEDKWKNNIRELSLQEYFSTTLSCIEKSEEKIFCLENKVKYLSEENLKWSSCTVSKAWYLYLSKNIYIIFLLLVGASLLIKYLFTARVIQFLKGLLCTI